MMMVNREIEICSTPELKYQAKVAEFEQRKAEMLSPPPPLIQPSGLLERIGIRRKPGPTAPISSPSQEQLAVLEQKFHSWLHADRKMVICHLRANPASWEAIINHYLQSPKLLNDPKTLGCLLEFWLLEFFQKTDTGEVENLFPFISSASIERLPRELQQAKKNIFEPLLRQLDEEALNQIKENLRHFGISSASQNLAQAIVSCKLPLSKPLIVEYQKYVYQLLKLEAGIVPITKNEPEPPKVKPARLEEKPREPTPTFWKQPPPSETPPSKEAECSFFIVVSLLRGPERINNLEKLAKAMEKIKRLGPVTPGVVWDRLGELAKMDYLLRMERYGERVAGGPFKGWYKIGLGDKWWILFCIEGVKIFFRVGHHDDVYATKRRKGQDRTRKL